MSLVDYRNSQAPTHRTPTKQPPRTPSRNQNDIIQSTTIQNPFIPATLDETSTPQARKQSPSIHAEESKENDDAASVYNTPVRGKTPNTKFGLFSPIPMRVMNSLSSMTPLPRHPLHQSNLNESPIESPEAQTSREVVIADSIEVIEETEFVNSKSLKKDVSVFDYRVLIAMVSVMIVSIFCYNAFRTEIDIVPDAIRYTREPYQDSVSDFSMNESLQTMIAKLQQEIEYLKSRSVSQDKQFEESFRKVDDSFKQLQTRISKDDTKSKLNDARFKEILDNQLTYSSELSKVSDLNDVIVAVKKDLSGMKSTRDTISPKLTKSIRVELTNMKSDILLDVESRVRQKFSAIESSVSAVHSTQNAIQSQLEKTNLALDEKINTKQETEYADFALLSGGAQIIKELTDYEPAPKRFFLLKLMMPTSPPHVRKAPETVLDPSTQIGNCFPLTGKNQLIGISLAHQIIPNRIRIHHLSSSASYIPSLPTAPRHITIYAVLNRVKARAYISLIRTAPNHPSHLTLDEKPAMYLTSGEYHRSGDGVFEVSDRVMEKVGRLGGVQDLVVEVEDNWGAGDVTCVYHVEVNGVIVE